METPVRIAIYTRVDTADQADIAFNFQERLLEAYAKKQGYEVVVSIRDIGNGLSCDRLGLNALLEISPHQVQGVLVKNVDRIGRDLIQVKNWIEQFETPGRKVLSMDDSMTFIRAIQRS
ncbi:MAG TPA: recombinase family protein [Candidatus Blautia excrementipullorum]|uniref:Recombinase family protein n=2 Tax=Eubacteriales TaxID=186802 RepID=A0A9D1DSB9_9FIRM|nr:recombinase family protein [Candidatus Gallacutalibacter pullicola]HIU30423.1 recombinase family protein [Candidatus Egerieisoma faecipullorum]HJB15426.1 recombinase family protein [Candidatus Blautia excrementipullorum]